MPMLRQVWCFLVVKILALQLLWVGTPCILQLLILNCTIMKEKYLKSEFNAVKCTRPRLVPMHMHIQVQTFVIFCIFFLVPFFFFSPQERKVSMCGLMVKMPKLFQEVYTIPILRKTWDIHRYKFIKNITFLFCNLMKHLWIVKNLTFLPEWTKIPAFTWYLLVCTKPSRETFKRYTFLKRKFNNFS